MPYYVTADVRVVAGEAARLMEALPGRSVRDGLNWYRAFTSETDPDRVLFVSSWRDVESFTAETVSYSEVTKVVEQHAVAGQSSYQGYHLLREIERISEPVGFCVALRRRIRPEHFDRWRSWAFAFLDEAREIPGVVALRLLRADSAPEDILVLKEFREESVHQRVLALLDRGPPPAPTEDRQVFLGHLRHRWDRSS